MAVDIDGAEYDKMVCLSLDILRDYGISDFPLDILTLAEHMGIKTIPYSSLAAQTYAELISKPGTEKGFTIAGKCDNGKVTYTVYYNDVDMTRQACRFTLAHEIKHIANNDFLKKELTEADEQLAEYFAKCLLAPQAIIIAERLSTPDDYVSHFDISVTAASIWFGKKKKRKYRIGELHLFDPEKEYLEEIGYGW